MSKPVWSTTFERFPTGTFPIVGPISLDVYDWGRPQDGHPRMFSQRLLERFTCAHPQGLMAAYLPGGLLMLGGAIYNGMSLRAVAAGYALGLFAWTLLEYLLHRFSFHMTPRGRMGVVYGYLIHGVHHAYPEDPERWVMPMIVTTPVGAAMLGLLWLLLGTPALAGFAGITHGYLAYDTVHYLIHARPMRSAVGIYLRKHHLQHHYASPERNFGVSTPLWDFVFRTTR